MPFHSYVFFDADTNINTVPSASLAKAKKEFAKCVMDTKDVRIQAYATIAFKAGSRFMLHMNAATPDVIQLLVRNLMHTKLGAHLKITYTLLGMTRHSQYNPKHPPKEADWGLMHRYLVVYPFTKTVAWHLMPYDDRRRVMKAHVEVGRKYSDKISQRLLYSYGVDDHEFIVSYQMDSLEDFQTLVMDMRETESRRHTKSDMPVFTCIHMPLSEALDMI